MTTIYNINCNKCNTKHSYYMLYNKELKYCMTLSETRKWLKNINDLKINNNINIK